MRAVVITRRAEAGNTASSIRAVEDWPEPAPPGPGWAQIRTLASALNHMDLWVAMGLPGLDLDYPRISGCDACGIVEVVGPGVDEAWIGRRVIFNAAIRQSERITPEDPTRADLAPSYQLIGEHTHGAHRERFTVPAANLQDVGECDPSDAAAFGLVGLTAYSMFTKAGVRPGQFVLITGIGGGVATALLALCRWAGCRIAVTSRHKWKLERAAGLGADCTLLDKGDEWSKEIRAWTGKRGVDVVFDSIGKAVHASCVASLARGGRFVTCGNTSGPVAETHLGRIFWNQLRLIGSTMGTNDEFAEAVALFRAGQTPPVVDSTHNWDQAPDAWRRLESAEQFGKIILRWD